MGGGVVQVSERPNSPSVSGGAHLTSVYSFSQWDHCNWLSRDRGICSADNVHLRNAEINWMLMTGNKATEHNMQQRGEQWEDR